MKLFFVCDLVGKGQIYSLRWVGTLAHFSLNLDCIRLDFYFCNTTFGSTGTVLFSGKGFVTPAVWGLEFWLLDFFCGSWKSFLVYLWILNGVISHSAYHEQISSAHVTVPEMTETKQKPTSSHGFIHHLIHSNEVLVISYFVQSTYTHKINCIQLM